MIKNTKMNMTYSPREATVINSCPEQDGHVFNQSRRLLFFVPPMNCSLRSRWINIL